MAIDSGKTKGMVIASRQKHQFKPLMLKLTLSTNIVEQVREHRVLRVTLDEDLRWQSQIDNVCKQLIRNLFLLGQLKPYVSTDCDVCVFVYLCDYFTPLSLSLSLCFALVYLLAFSLFNLCTANQISLY